MLKLFSLFSTTVSKFHVELVSWKLNAPYSLSSVNTAFGLQKLVLHVAEPVSRAQMLLVWKKGPGCAPLGYLLERDHCPATFISNRRFLRFDFEGLQTGKLNYESTVSMLVPGCREVHLKCFFEMQMKISLCTTFCRSNESV